MTGAYIAGIYEHPERVIPDKSLQTVFQEILRGVLEDSNLAVDDIDGIHSSMTPGSVVGLVEQLGLVNVRHFDGTDLGGATYVGSLGAARRAIESGEASAVLVIMAGLPRRGLRNRPAPSPMSVYESAHGASLIAQYALVAQRYLHEYGASRADLAEAKVASAFHASFNPHAMLPTRVTVQEVLDAPAIAEPLHRLDCCVVSDGGGAFIVVNEEIATSLSRPTVKILATSSRTRNWNNGKFDLLDTGAATSVPDALHRSGVTLDRIDYASIYASFTITLLLTLEQAGFANPGQAGQFIRDGGITGPSAPIPVNTDGGGLSNNHPDMRGGMIRTLEAVRQLRGSAHPELQVADCEFALVHGTGHSLGTRHASISTILQRVDP